MSVKSYTCSVGYVSSSRAANRGRGATGAIYPGPQLLRGPQLLVLNIFYSCKNNFFIVNFGNFGLFKIFAS